MTPAIRIVTPSTPEAGPAPKPVTDAEQVTLQDIATIMGAVLTGSVQVTPSDALAPAPAGELGDEAAGRAADAAVLADAPDLPAGEAASDAGAGFSEGTQALLDRLERLGDMRDRGLLTVEEFETAKASIIAELETRS